MELSTRNQSAQFGLHLSFNLHAAMLHDADPNESLQIVKFIDRLKMELEKNPSYLVDKTREFLINNKSRIVEFHSLSFVSVKRKKLINFQKRH